MTSTTQPLTKSSRAARVGAALRTEAGLARLAIGIATLHVLDDNFLQPQPGTSAADHLAGGLVQAGLFILFAWAYPRLRPGSRGTLAIFAGLFIVVIGVGEAGYYTRENGTSGDDYTGLLAIPAGFLLFGIGLVTLWRSKKGGSPVRRYLRRGLLALAFVIGAYMVVYPVSEAYVVTHTARASVPTADLGTPHEDVSFTTSDGLQLEGWYVPTRNGATVVVIPGRKGPQKPARLLAQHGYGVLLFDRRGEGASEGDPNGFGWAGTHDVQAAIAFLRDRPEVDGNRIGGLGLSVGGEMLLQTAAETDDLKAVVSEGAGFRSVREAVDLPGPARFMAVPILALATASTAIFTSDLPPRGLTELSSEIHVPVFFIYASSGQGGESLNRTYYEAANQPKEIWSVDSGHTGAIDAERQEYERRVVAFFDRALLRDE